MEGPAGQHPVDILEAEVFDRPQIIGHGAVVAGVGPFRADVKEAAAGAFAEEHPPPSELVAVLLELPPVEALLGRPPVDLVDHPEELLGVFGVAGELGGEHAGVEEVLVVAGGLFGPAGIDHRPVEPAAGGVAEDRRQELGGEAVVVVAGRAAGHLHGVLERRRRAGDELEGRRVRRPEVERGATGGNRQRLPVTAPLPGRADKRLEIDGACGAEDDVGRRVAAAVVVAHRLDRHPLDRFDRPQHAPRQRMMAEEGRPAAVVGAERRLVVVHPDLLQDDELFGVEVVLAEGGAHHPRQQRRCLDLLFGEDGGVVGGVFFARERIGAGAHPVEAPVDLVGREVVGALEHHVLEEVAHAPLGVGLVAGAGLHEEADARGEGRVGDFGDHIEAVGETFMQKLHAAPPAVLCPATRSSVRRGGSPPASPPPTPH